MTHVKNVFLLVLTTLLTACGATPAPKELVEARAAYNRAASGPANSVNPAQVHVAKESLDIAERSFADDPSSPETRDRAYIALCKSQLAEAQAGSGEFERAAVHARRVLDRAPANATANLVVGLTMMEEKNYAAARDALQKAIAADPDSPKAFYQLSLALARLGDDEGARQYVQLYQDRLRAVEERVNALRAGGATTTERARPPRVPR